VAVAGTLANESPTPGTATAWSGDREAARTRLRALAWPVVLALTGLAAAAPLWSSALLPFQDGPQHLASVRVIADYHAPGLGFDRWFVLDLRRLEYLGFYLPAAALAKWIGTDAATRVLLSLIALALPAATWMLLGAFGRDRRLAVFAPALFHTTPLYLGFFNFVASVPALIAAVALTERELRAPSPRRAVALALLAVALIWLHPSALAFALGAAVFLGATSGARPRQLVRGVLPLAPAALLFALWMVRDFLAPKHSTRGSGLVLSPLREHVLDLLRFGNVLAGHADEGFVAALALLLVAAALLPGKPEAERRSWRLPLLAGFVLAAVLAAPFGIGNAGFIYLRALPLLFVLGLSSLRLSRRPAASALLALAALLQIGYAGVLASAYRAFDREAEAPQLRRVLQAADPGRRLLSLVHGQQSAVVQGQSYLHFGQYYQVQRGGRARFNFGEYPWTPVRLRPGTAAPLPPGFEAHPERFDPSRDGDDADYLLVRGPAPAPGGRFVLRAHEGRWSLYEQPRG
jgi:hypothetical protein